MRALVFVLVLAGCGSSAPLVRPTPVAGANDHLIIAGQRVGPIALGMGMAEVFAAVGAPTSSSPYNHSHRWDTVSAGFVGQPEWVWYAEAGDASYATPEGLHTGSTEFEVRAKLGTPMRVANNRYVTADGSSYTPDGMAYELCYANGIAFEFMRGFGNDDVVNDIRVYPPGRCFME